MNISKAIIAGIAGTTLMTAFSYLVSNADKENYREPALLAEMEKDILPRKAKKLATPAGWATHYMVGIAFALAYKLLTRHTGIKPGIKNGILMGAAAGIIGAVVWKASFRVHPDEPQIPYTKFYTQLLPAHIIFGVTVALTDSLLNQKPVR